MVSLFALLFSPMHTEYHEYSCERTHLQTNWGVCRHANTRGSIYCTHITLSYMQLVREKLWVKGRLIRNVLALSKCLSLYPSVSPLTIQCSFWSPHRLHFFLRAQTDRWHKGRGMRELKKENSLALLWGVSRELMRNIYLYQVDQNTCQLVFPPTPLSLLSTYVGEFNPLNQKLIRVLKRWLDPQNDQQQSIIQF